MAAAAAFIRRFPWTGGQLAAIRRAAAAGASLQELVSWVDRARREVTD